MSGASLKPDHSTKSHKADKFDKFKHSFTGLNAKHGDAPKKDGAGGKGVWGSWKEELEADASVGGGPTVDPRDPNYEDPADAEVTVDRK